jgi:MFS family permease
MLETTPLLLPDSNIPINWPKPYKWSIVFILAAMAFITSLNCCSVVPIANIIISDLGSDKSSSVLFVTIWELGEAAGPLIIAPLSEIYGRSPVYNIANIGFILTTILAATSSTTSTLIVARFFTGLSVASNVLSPAIVGDIFISEQRGKAMSSIMLAPILGGAVGPAIAGSIADLVGWRSVLLLSATLASICEIAFFFLFKETYTVQKRSKEDFIRPIIIFWNSSILQAMAIFAGLAFTYFYIISTTLPDILEGYELSPALIGVAFVSVSCGSILMNIVCNLTLDRIYVKLRGDGPDQPEYRLPLLIVAALVLPLTIAFYGWSANRFPLPVMLISTCLIGASLTLTLIPAMGYVVDAFGRYAASAVTAMIITRCLMSTFLPLITVPLVEKLGYGFGFSIYGMISLLLAPIPILMMRYGKAWRRRSSYTTMEE